MIAVLGCTRWLNVFGSNPPVLNGAQLGFRRARYAVRGRVRSFGDRILVVMRMFEFTTGRHIWGDAFEGTPEGALELQQRVTEGVASSIPALLRDAEGTRNKESIERDPKVVDHVIQAFRATFEITQSASDYALDNLDRAQCLDPHSRLRGPWRLGVMPCVRPVALAIKSRLITARHGTSQRLH